MPSDKHELRVFHKVYTTDVLNRMAVKAKDDEGLRSLHLMLTSNTEHFEIKRIHFDKCLAFAMENGCLDEDRRNRLTNPDSYHVWLSTYYELLVPYFFASVFSKKIQCVASPSKRGLGDFQVIQPEGNIVAEVKTPKGDDAFSNGQKHAEYHGHGDEFINTVFKGAGKQLQKASKNLLVICPQLCTWIQNSKPFIWYLYGKEVLVAEGGELKSMVLPDGELLRHRPPRFKRISCVGSFQIDYSRRSTGEGLPVSFTLFHNYFAKKHIPVDVFDGVEQYVINERTNQITPVNTGNCRFVIHE